MMTRGTIALLMATAIAVPLAFMVAGFIGILIEQGIIRFLYGRPLETLLATWGLSLILQQAVRTVFGPTNKADAKAWEGITDGAGYTASGYKAGDKTAWEAQLKARTERGQNEYTHVGSAKP